MNDVDWCVGQFKEWFLYVACVSSSAYVHINLHVHLCAHSDKHDMSLSSNKKLDRLRILGNKYCHAH